MNVYYQQLLRVDEDETTDSITKWRNFVFTQITRIKIAELYHQQDINECKNEMFKLEAILQDSRDKLCEIQAINQSLNDEYNQAEEKNLIVQSQYDKAEAVQECNADMQIKLRILLRTIEHHTKHFGTKLKDLQNPKNEIFTKIEKLSMQIDNAKKRIDRMMKEINTRKKKQYESSVEKNYLDKEIQALKEKIAKTIIPEIPDELIAIRHEFKSKQEALYRLQAYATENEKLKGQINSTKLSVLPDERNTLNMLINKEIETQNELLRNLENNYNTDNLEKEINDSKNRAAELEKKLNEIKERTKNQEQQINQAYILNSALLSQKISENNQRIENLMKKESLLKEKLSSFEEEEETDQKESDPKNSSFLLSSDILSSIKD